MKINKQITIIAIACFVLGTVVFFTFHNRQPAGSDIPTVSDTNQVPDANVNSIVSPQPSKGTNPPVISQSSDSKSVHDVIDPEKATA